MTNRVTGIFTATGAGEVLTLLPNYPGSGANPPGAAAALWGSFVATVELERSRDGGTTWNVVSKTPDGDGAIYQDPVDINIYDTVIGTKYRWNCTAYVSGTVNYDVAQ